MNVPVFIPAILAVTLAGSGAGQQWQQYATPEQAGWSAEGLEAARDIAIEVGSAAVFMTVKGKVLIAWGQIERKFRCHSVRKSIMSALIGIHVENSDLDLDATLGDLGIEDRQPLSDVEKTARVVDLLRARSGVYHPAAKETPDMGPNRPKRGSHRPGSHFWYNNWDFNTLGAIFEQETGLEIYEEFRDAIARPIGMEDFEITDGHDEWSPTNSNFPAYAFRLSARDLARFGQLFLQNGRWGDEQIVSAAWVEESTTAHSTVTGNRGYGYMWWTYERARNRPGTIYAYDRFAAVGTGGQLILVIPEAEVVLVHRGDTDNERRVSGRDVYRMIDQVFEARTGAVAEDPELGPVEVRPLGKVLPEIPVHTAVDLDPACLDDYAGDYEAPVLGTVRVFRWRARLFVRLLALGEEAELTCMGEDEFFVHGHRVRVGFAREDGEVTHAIVRDGPDRLRAPKKS